MQELHYCKILQAGEITRQQEKHIQAGGRTRGRNYKIQEGRSIAGLSSPSGEAKPVHHAQFRHDAEANGRVQGIILMEFRVSVT